MTANKIAKELEGRWELHKLDTQCQLEQWKQHAKRFEHRYQACRSKLVAVSIWAAVEGLTIIYLIVRSA